MKFKVIVHKAEEKLFSHSTKKLTDNTLKDADIDIEEFLKCL